MEWMIAGAFFLTFSVGIIWTFHDNRRYVRFRIRPQTKFRQMMIAISDQGSDDIFEKAGLQISMKRYTAFRNLITLVCIGALILKIVWEGSVVSAWIPMLILVALYLISWPAKTWGKKNQKTPFAMILDGLRRSYSEAKDDELMGMITQLKNIIVTQQGSPKSADFMIEALLRFSHRTRPIFTRVLSYLRLGRPEEAYHYFYDHFGTRLGQDFAAVLLKLDALDPAELLLQVSAFQDSVQEERRTRRANKQQANGEKVFTLASILVLLIMVDFMYIALGKVMEALYSI